MSRFRRLGQLMAATTVTATALAGLPAAAFAADEVTFSVANFTDFHGHLLPSDELTESKEMGAAKLQALVNHVNENQDYVLTSSGDNVGGSAFVSAIDQDNATMDALNAMDVKVSAVGNHEFDQGVEDLTGRITEKSNFPILGTNVYQNGERLLPATHVEEIDGVKVGFVGTVTTLTKSKVAPDKIGGVEFRDPVAETNQEAKALKDSGEADVVVALMHEDAQQYIDGFDDSVDVVFGGDSHQKTSGTVPREGQPDMVWAQGHEYGKLLNDVDLTYDREAKKLTNAVMNQYSAADAAELPDDPQVAEIVEQAKAVADEKGKDIVGSIEAPLQRASSPGNEPGSNRGAESTGNNFIAEANREILSRQTGKNVQIGIMNAGGVRENLEAGDVTYEQAATVQPFNNDISVGDLTGADIIQLLEQQWKTDGERARLGLGLSEGFTYTYDPAAEQDNRVLSATLNGEPVDPEATYTVATSSFLFAGGDGFDAFTNATNVVNVGANDLQVYTEYLGDENHQYPFTQRDAGVEVEGDLKAGETVTFNLSALNYTSEGEPKADNVTVTVDGVSETAPINNEPGEGDEGGNGHGRAEVELTLPENLSENAVVEITTDVEGGQEAPISIPVQALGDVDTDPSDSTDDEGESGETDGNGETGEDDSENEESGDNQTTGGAPARSSNGSADLAFIGGAAALAAIAASMIGDAVAPWADQVRKTFGF